MSLPPSFQTDDAFLVGRPAHDVPRRSYRALLVGGLVAVLAILAWSAQPTPRSAPTQQQSYQDNLPLLGKNKHSKTKKHDAPPSGLDYCMDGSYSKRTLQLAYELPFFGLFQDPKGQTKFEASAVTLRDGTAYAVCDSSWALSQFPATLTPFAGLQVGDPHRESDDSGYEGLFFDDDSLYVVRESIQQHGDETYHAVLEELAVNENNDDYTVLETCSSEFTFEGDSKGFEGAVAVHDLEGHLVVLGLCEGNFCSEKHKDEAGNGKVVAMRKDVEADGNSCIWRTIRVLDVPSSAYFRDYSDMTLDDATGKVAVASQEESQLWVGQLVGRIPSGLWDVDNMYFDTNVGKVYDFPKNDNCETIYCNIEGVHWMSENTIMAVSDKMKGKGKQDFRCFDKDQHVHVFVIP